MTKPIQASILLVITVSSMGGYALSQTVSNLAPPPVFRQNEPLAGYTRNPFSPGSNPAIIPQNWARGNQATQNHHEQVVGLNPRNAHIDSSTESPRRANLEDDAIFVPTPSNQNKLIQQNNKSVRHIVTSSPAKSSSNPDDFCADRLCYGLPSQCLGGAEQNGQLCSVLVTSKRLLDPTRPNRYDILFELIALPSSDSGNYAAVGFSENGRMQGLVSECVQSKESNSLVKLRHSYNLPGAYTNVPVTILSGIKSFSSSFENGYYQCRWIVESGVEFSYEALNGTVINKREDLGYRNYHILLASGQVDASGGK